MFANNNKKIIRTLALRNLKEEKTRSIIIIITISIATMLACVCMLIGNGYKVQEEEYLNRAQHVIYEDVTAEELEALEDEQLFNDSIQMKRGTSFEFEEYAIQFAYVEDKETKMHLIPIYEGEFPEEKNEILIDKRLANRYESAIGDKIQLNLSEEDEAFIISGIYEVEKPLNENYVIYTSKEYSANGEQLKAIPYDLCVRVDGAEYMEVDEFMNAIDGIGGEVGIPKYRINPNNSFTRSLSTTTADLMETLTYALISIFILIVSAIVIYSVFYIAVLGKVAELGQLRTLGTTNKQVGKIVKYEGRMLSRVGILLGVLCGNIFAYVFQPEGFSLQSYLWCNVFVIVFVWSIVRISINKPAKIAGAVSPIEASRNVNGNKGSEIKVKRYKKLTLWQLAIRNRKMNHRKFIMTNLSLGLTGTIFIIGATFLVSFNIESNARQAEFVFHDIRIGLDRESIEASEENGIDLQMEGIYDDELLSTIGSIDGVEEIVKIPQVEIDYMYQDLRNESQLSYMTEEDFAVLKEYQKDLAVTYEELVDQKGVIINANDIHKEIYGYEIEVGDEIEFSWYEGTKRVTENFTVLGCTDIESTASMYGDKVAYHLQMAAGWFMMSQETVQEMFGSEFDATYELLINTNWQEGDDEVIEEVVAVIDEEENLQVYSTIVDLMEQAKTLYKSLFVMVFAILLFLGLFSVINLFNTIITNVLSRKKEFEMMQSIGLTGRQLKRIVLLEGMIFGIYNSVLAGVLGGVGGYTMVAFLRKNDINYLVWEFPATHYLGYVIGTFVLTAIISYGSARKVIKARNKSR